MQKLKFHPPNNDVVTFFRVQVLLLIYQRQKLSGKTIKFKIKPLLHETLVVLVGFNFKIHRGVIQWGLQGSVFQTTIF
jgi:hypothetical protein